MVSYTNLSIFSISATLRIGMQVGRCLPIINTEPVEVACCSLQYFTVVFSEYNFLALGN